MLSKKVEFLKAIPVWAEGLETEMNVNLIFNTAVNFTGSEKTILRISGSSAFSIKVNGKFFGMGPARAGHGHYRVDEYILNDELVSGENKIEILVAGYCQNSFYWIDQPSFLCAEILQDGTPVIWTSESDNGFKAYTFAERTVKVQRYSFQRNFAEVYDYNRKTDYEKPVKLVHATAEEKVFIERGIFYPGYEKQSAKSIVCQGTTGVSEKDKYYDDRAVVNIGPNLKGFKIDELEVCSAWQAQKLDFDAKDYTVIDNSPISVARDGFAVYDMGINTNGLIGFDIDCESDVTVYALFDEIIAENDPNKLDFLRLGCSSVIMWTLPKGKYSLLSFEPYVFKYLRIAVMGGAAKVSDVHVRRVGYYMPDKKIKTDNPKLKAVYDAAIETFRQNTCDIYMDCASRERAGWLCDSFFTSRVERTLTGKSEVERNFLENFLQPKSFKYIPEGMLPMCYPADHYDSVFIPNWAMWYVVELEEYLARSGDSELIAAAKERVYGLLKYFKGFENKDGLLERLESWVFVEWSKANELVQDLNFPSNMLYCKMKRVMSRLYGDETLAKEADALEKKIKELSFGGKFFRDNAVYENGVLKLTENYTEACQYYAFHTGIATPEEYPELWDTLVKDFGPQRKQTGKWPEVYFANAFIGNYLRLDLLNMYGYTDEILDNMEGYFYYMAEKTGTLWENDTDFASCSHGFASHVIYWFDKLGMLE
ncbi:MAG: hypothetical protein IJZ94_00825 [Clostridia bacterium]|nr:hypothetical protein [Clostridia bacterium]